jgi:hypothetical protein
VLNPARTDRYKQISLFFPYIDYPKVSWLAMLPFYDCMHWYNDSGSDKIMENCQYSTTRHYSQIQLQRNYKSANEANYCKSWFGPRGTIQFHCCTVKSLRVARLRTEEATEPHPRPPEQARSQQSQSSWRQAATIWAAMSSPPYHPHVKYNKTPTSTPSFSVKTTRATSV